MVKLMGYYQLPGSMPVQVSFEDLFNTSFMRKYTKYRSFEKFLLGGGFHIEIQQDFEDLPEEKYGCPCGKKYKIQQLEGNAGCGY